MKNEEFHRYAVVPTVGGAPAAKEELKKLYERKYVQLISVNEPIVICCFALY